MPERLSVSRSSVSSTCPATAAIACGLDKHGGEQRIIADKRDVGTFDVSLLSIDDDVFEALVTAGDSYLVSEVSGSGFIDYFVKQYKQKTGFDVTNNLRALGKLNCEIEKAINTLSSQQSTRRASEFFAASDGFSETLTRTKFEEFSIDLSRKAMVILIYVR